MVYYRKSGFPRKEELVVCTVKKVIPHAAFCILDEYHEKEGMLHISEISSKWVKNIKKHVSEGKRIVCKVIELDEDKGHVNLSLRKVSEGERERKLEEWRLEKRMDKLLQFIEDKLDKEEGSYEEVGDAILDEYGALFVLYEKMKEEDGRRPIDKVNMSDEWADAIYETISNQIKSQQVSIKAKIFLHSDYGEGVENLKELFDEFKKFCSESNINYEIKYIGTPEFMLSIMASGYKGAEKNLEKSVGFFEEESKNFDAEFSWERDDRK